MSIRAFGTELDSPGEDADHAAPVTMTNAVILPTFPRIRESLDEEGEEEEESIGGREHGGTSSIAGTGGVTTDSDRNDDDYTTMTSITTPSSKRNKRKMTEPRRRRTDFSIRSLCSNSDDEEPGTRTEETPLKRTKRIREEENVLKPSPSSASTLILPPPGSTYTTPSSLLGPFALDPSFDRRQGPRPDTPSTAADPSFPFDFAPSRRPPRKNYKNMTKQRRIEANARERTRVHTISAAFESLRRAVPSYSYNQRLSKLAILRIASSYILALATLAELDYGGGGGGGQRGQTFGDCVDLCTQTIQAEGRAKRRH